MTNELMVLLDGRYIGVLRRTRGPKGDRLSFRYDEAWLAERDGYPLSLCMPRVKLEHTHERVEAYIWGLLPDNELVIERWAKQFQVSPRSAFGLLAYVGEECAGAVQFVRPERLDALQKPSREKVLWVDEGAVGERLRALRENEAAWRSARDEGQFSLAGAQPKTALFFDGLRWGVPQGRTPTTHILKPPTAAFQGHAENEHVCLELARSVGLPAAISEVRRFDGEVAIVVERFDRIRVKERPRSRAAGPVRRVHQEDMCQALGVFPQSKYQNEGGPSPGQISRLLRDHSRRPAEDVNTFFDALVFNWLIGGTDAHAKNYAVLHGSASAVRLAPLYDLASALPYPQLDQRRLKLAMKVGGTYSLRDVDAASFRKLAKELGAREDEMLARARRLTAATAERIPDVVESARRAGLKHPIVQTLGRLILERARKCLARLDAGQAAPRARDDSRDESSEYLFERMYVVSNRVVAEVRAASGEIVVVDPYRPGRASISTGDSVRLGANGQLHRTARAGERDVGR